jgi:hypothetical protein
MGMRRYLRPIKLRLMVAAAEIRGRSNPLALSPCGICGALLYDLPEPILDLVALNALLLGSLFGFPADCEQTRHHKAES